MHARIADLAVRRQDEEGAPLKEHVLHVGERGVEGFELVLGVNDGHTLSL